MAAMKRCTKCREMKPADPDHFYREGKYDFKPQCKDCIRKARAEKKGKKMPAPTPKPAPEGTTRVTCKCGHQYDYKVNKPQAVKWLEKQPCPPCRAKLKNEEKDKDPKQAPDGEKKQPEVPEMPETPKTPKAPEKKVDKKWVEDVMQMMPAALYHEVLPDIVLLLRAGLPVWMQGPPGTSKSTLAEQAAKALGVPYHFMPCHEFMTRSDLFGFTDANGKNQRTPLWEAFEKGGVLLLDEVDNGNPNLLAAINGALSNGHGVFGSGTPVERHPDFYLVATANTAGLGPEHGYIGRNGVDLATRDRFVTVQVPIDGALESALAELYMGGNTDSLIDEFTSRARRRLERRSRDREQLTSGQVVTAIGKVRAAVDTRFRGSVVSPRATIHTAAMVNAGFGLNEAIEAKLPGLKPSDVKSLLKEVLV